MSDQVVYLHDVDGKLTHAVVPIDEYRELTDAAFVDDDDRDAADLAEAIDEDDGLRLPLEFVRRLQAGENVIRVLRDLRGMSQGELAAKMGTEPNYISQIEGGHRKGIRKAISFADALGVPVSFVRERLHWDKA